MAELRVVLLGMTGFGNGVLQGLLGSAGVSVACVVTPPPPAGSGAFPYYPCEPLAQAAAAAGIPHIEGPDLRAPRLLDALRALAPELIVVGSFPAVVPQAVIALPGRGVINFHPSLLPRYRGATPTYWALLHGEAETGATAHWIEDERLDAGKIILQKRLAIGADWDDGRLRRELSALIADMVPEVVALAICREREAFPDQDEARATSFPRRPLRPVPIELEGAAEGLVRLVRAASPFPGALVRVGERLFRVRRAQLFPATDVPRAGSVHEVRVRMQDGDLRLELEEETGA